MVVVQVEGGEAGEGGGRRLSSLENTAKDEDTLCLSERLGSGTLVAFKRSRYHVEAQPYRIPVGVPEKTEGMSIQRKRLLRRQLGTKNHV